MELKVSGVWCSSLRIPDNRIRLFVICSERSEMRTVNAGFLENLKLPPHNVKCYHVRYYIIPIT